MRQPSPQIDLHTAVVAAPITAPVSASVPIQRFMPVNAVRSLEPRWRRGTWASTVLSAERCGGDDGCADERCGVGIQDAFPFVADRSALLQTFSNAASATLAGCPA